MGRHQLFTIAGMQVKSSSMVIDCHVHLSLFNHEGQAFSQVRDDLVSSMQTQGIDYAFVYADSEPDTGVADLDASWELVREQPQLLLLGTTTIPLSEVQIIDRLDQLAETGDIIGIKLYPGFELFSPGDDACNPVYELCLQHRMPVVFHAGETMGETWREDYNHPREMAKAAQKFPELTIVIAHFAQPHLAACREVLLNYPNIYVDISGLAHPDVERHCGKEKIVEILADIAKQHPEKILFGTDWPICDVNAHLQLVSSLPISEALKALILSGNAKRIFSL